MTKQETHVRGKSSRVQKGLRILLYTFTAAVLLCLTLNVSASCLVTRADHKAPRNPDTGILLGAEARDLGPEDAPNAVLFVHGFVGAGNNFADLPDLLAAKGWRVRVMRLPGHGTSPRDLAGVTTDDLLKAVHNELEALRAKHQRVILIGHSMGGALSTITAARDQVDALVLGAPYFGVTYHWFYILRPETWSRLNAHVLRWVYKGKLFLQVNDKSAKDHIVSYKWIPSHFLLTLTDVGKRARQPEVLQNVKCPVLFIHADGDTAASPKAAWKAFDAMASANKQAVRLTRSDHHIFWDYEHEEVMEKVLAFIASLKP